MLNAPIDQRSIRAYSATLSMVRSMAAMPLDQLSYITDTRLALAR
jgi:hypothetical protein